MVPSLQDVALKQGVHSIPVSSLPVPFEAGVWDGIP